MPHSHFRQYRLALLVSLALTATLSHATKKNLPASRWTAGAPGCEFQRTEDGHLRWKMVGDDLDITLVVDAQELNKSHRRLYHVFGVYMSVNYTGQGRYDFPADLRIEFVRHHNLIEGYLDPDEFSTNMQNDVDTLVFDTEREIKKHPEKTEEKTARAREYQKEVSEFIEFLSTQTLQPGTLNPGNPEAHGWVFFSTKNKWLGPWKSREDFILRVWMNDKIWEFPFSLPPSEIDLNLQKRD